MSAQVSPSNANPPPPIFLDGRDPSPVHFFARRLGYARAVTAPLGFGIPALFAGLVVVEAGVPLPIPGDVLMLLIGERAAAHALPLWLAVTGLEAVVLVGTTALFIAARGPAQTALFRVARRVGL